ncbi:circularly permuted type 2 ATP-grasp protein [Ilumatobacter nonamiensis]|uniref:circularly permuted type 2 ATP-grasp protein n=1 Tax=Ilumatobacter nonamiensis TaxID=467093 RepID=UPI0011D1E095|nr:circularly permuted type 2 ATP-grasp protein [Ilumatobacter nonamiensis]
MRPTADPIAGYRPRGGVHDEMVDADGSIRDHWSELMNGYRTLGAGELSQREAEIQRLLEQDGVTYNVGGEDGRPDRPWKLDPIPFVLPSEEWSHLERGMIQRAELLDLVLRDLYGERRLLRSGVVPPEMVLADPQFFRACDRITLPSRKQLVVFGTDIVRAADGGWMALGHRAQAPSGAAYALENRRVLSRVFPQAFRRTGVRRLGSFVPALRSALLAAAPVGVDDPSIVILSPGSLSETAFEHASIAAQLGYPLVQGSDFELRNGRVGLRTVGGWVPVHVILRRVDAGFCDPLALRADSTLGIPGLVDACRAGTVSVVNTLGSGVLENAGLAGLMSTLSRQLLGEDLQLESVPSWWCGEPAGRSHVIAKLGSIVVRPLSRVSLEHSIDTERVSRTLLDELRRRIEARPDQWVGQERVSPGSTPVLHDGGFESRPTVLRSFAVADGESYVAMRGGLGRTGSGDVDAPITNRAGASSKDIWVLRSASQSPSPSGSEFLPSDHAVPSAASTEALPARVAENLFWLGRYAERAEATVRLIRTVTARCDEFLDAAAGPGPASLTVVLEALTRLTGTYPGFVGDDAEKLFEDPTDELFSLVVDERRPGTVAYAVRRMFDALDVVRDQTSVDTWLVVGSLQRELERVERRTDDHDAMTRVLSELLQGLLSLSGIASESMVRDLGWQFMDAGRRIERSIHVATLVGTTLGTQRSAPVESLAVESVLVAGESIITSRRRYGSRAVAATTIELLLADAGNPRSLRFQVDRLVDNPAIIGRDATARPTAAATLLDELNLLLTATDFARLAEVDERGHRTQLEAFVDAVRAKLAATSNAVTAESFRRLHAQFTMAGPLRQEQSTAPVGSTRGAST